MAESLLYQLKENIVIVVIGSPAQYPSSVYESQNGETPADSVQPGNNAETTDADGNK